MKNIEISIRGDYDSARSAKLNRKLTLDKVGDSVSFTLPLLQGYDVVLLEKSKPMSGQVDLR